MSEKTEDRHAIVTGASRGIGRAVALALGRTGASVTVNYRGNLEAAQEVVGALEALGARAAAVQADVTQVQDARRLFDDAEAQLGPVDVVVANVGVPVFRPVAEVTDEQFEQGFGAITRATFALLQEAARRTRDGGRIVIVSSGAAVSPRAAGALYGAAKAAVDFFGASLAAEVGPRGITVNSVMPGLTRTDGMILPPEQVEAMVAQTPLGRLGEPEEVAAVVAFLASPQAGWVTGQRFAASGGLS
jgi:3-oxoacyl-[acyl-carrier protein] reductase